MWEKMFGEKHKKYFQDIFFSWAWGLASASGSPYIHYH